MTSLLLLSGLAFGGDFEEGRKAGVEAARSEPMPWPWLGIGAASGCVPALGCCGAMAAAQIIDPKEPLSGLPSEDAEFQEGFSAGYSEIIRRRRTLAAASGGVVTGSAVSLGYLLLVTRTVAAGS